MILLDDEEADRTSCRVVCQIQPRILRTLLHELLGIIILLTDLHIQIISGSKWWRWLMLLERIRSVANICTHATDSVPLFDINTIILLVLVDDKENSVVFQSVFQVYISRWLLVHQLVIDDVHTLGIINDFVVLVWWPLLFSSLLRSQGWIIIWCVLLDNFGFLRTLFCHLIIILNLVLLD